MAQNNSFDGALIQLSKIVINIYRTEQFLNLEFNMHLILPPKGLK